MPQEWKLKQTTDLPVFSAEEFAFRCEILELIKERSAKYTIAKSKVINKRHTVVTFRYNCQCRYLVSKRELPYGKLETLYEGDVLADAVKIYMEQK